ncbi:MAG: CBS domain-containing protein [Kofleriaceae bacterium]|nr:CBS domain-containing protein [Kofleriaceae bacterium]MCL4225952.1 CBS domain-containing protein [Myxococcales bacterium]
MRRLTRTIEEIGWTDVPRLPASATVAAALELMRNQSHDSVLVLRGDGDGDGDGAGEGLVGIFTSRDVMTRVAAPRRDVATVTLAEVMTPAPRTLAPSDPVAFAINWMAIEGFRNVPVVEREGGGRVRGVLTVWDVMRQISSLFDEIDATPRDVAPQDDISGVTTVDLGGGA